MAEVELLGGVFDGLRFGMPSDQEFILVPIAFFYTDGAVTGAEVQQFGRTGRVTDDGRPVYRLLNHVIGQFAGGEPSNR